MTELTQPNISPEIAKSKMILALGKAEKSVQGLHDTESKLTYNEDNLGVIKLFIENCKSAEKIVDAERIRLKEPSLQESRNIDSGAKLVSTDLANLRNKAQEKYTKICQEVEKKRQEAEKERQRIENIRAIMDVSKLDFSVKIAGAKTLAELVDIERRVNLETGNKNRYQEFLPEFAEACKAIRSLITAQKNKVRELSDLQLQASQASENNDDGAFLDIQEKIEEKTAQIAETAIHVQETALHQASNPTTTAEVILPIIPSGGRNYLRWEVLDNKAAFKAGLMMLVPDQKKIDEILKEKRKDGTEIVENGIRYFKQKTF